MLNKTNQVGYTNTYAKELNGLYLLSSVGVFLCYYKMFHRPRIIESTLKKPGFTVLLKTLMNNTAKYVHEIIIITLWVRRISCSGL
jgi:hypothetical protein